MVKYNENAIKEAAYYNWKNAGCPMGQDEYFWSMAVEQLSNCSNSKKSCSSTKKTTSCKSSTSTKSAACKSSSSSKKSK